MPNLWTLDESPPGHMVSTSAVTALLDTADGQATAARLLAFVNQVVPVEYLSMVEFGPDGPRLIDGCAGHSGTRDVVEECFAIYLQRYYQSDAITGIAARAVEQPAQQVSAMHCRADELPVDGWRNDIYASKKLTARLSFLHVPRPGRVVALHLYRDERQGLFQPVELDRLLAVAPLVRQAHAMALQGENTPALHSADPVQRATQLLRERAQRLSARELAVSARIACGISVDGIAEDLDIAPSTVITLRKRAYLKLGDANLPAHRLGLAQWVSRATR